MLGARHFNAADARTLAACSYVNDAQLFGIVAVSAPVKSASALRAESVEVDRAQLPSPGTISHSRAESWPMQRP